MFDDVTREHFKIHLGGSLSGMASALRLPLLGDRGLISVRVRSLIAVVVVAIGICAGAYAADPAILLEKGLYLEETKGDLDAAIEVYRQIIQEAEANRRYLAEAYYRLGMCYLKKGQQEQASEAFEKLMARFPEQQALIAAARKHISAARFPKFVGCRIKETVALEVKPGRKPKGFPQPRVIYENSYLEIQWQIDAEIKKKTKHFAVGVLPLEADVNDPDTHVWLAVGIPATVSSASYGKSWADEIGFRHPLTRDPQALLAGEYWIYVLAYDVEASKFDGNDVIGSGRARLTVKPMPYTQISILEVQPDGTIRMRNISQQVNRSGKEQTAVGFRNSDFVHLTSMSDDQGRPIQFTAKHQGNIYRYNATLNEPVPPSQPVIYASEGTITGFVKKVAGKEEEFQYKLTHWPAAGKPTRRVEVYRLPQGAELLETTPADMTRRTKDGRIELFVEKMVPTGGNITTAFRYRLSGAKLAPEEPLKLNPAPWPHGEVIRLNLLSMAGMEVGTMIFSIESAKVDDTPAWRLQSYLVVSIADSHQFARVDAERDSFVPITSRTKNQMGDFRAEYAPDKVNLKVQTAGKESERQIRLGRTAYDNEQVLHLIRRLPLAEGYRASFPIFPVQGGMVLEGRIEVTGKEKLTVPAGTFDCYKIDLSVYAAEVQALQHDVWISADEHQYLVKYDSKSAIMELAEVTVKEKDETAQFEDQELGISLRAPAGWYFYKNPSLGAYKYKFMLQVIPPELKAWAVFTGGEFGSLALSARTVAEMDVEVLKGYFKGYTVRADSWTDLQVSDMPAVSYIADYQHQGKEMVEYRTYMLGKSIVYWFVFRIERKEFKASRHEFDSIVRSLKTKEKLNEKATSLIDLSSRGWQLWAQKKWAEAEEAFKEAVSKEPSDANAWNGLGWSQFHLGTRKDAELSFRKCLEIEPEHAGALNGLGWIAKGQGKTEEAIGYWEKAIEALPSATAALNGLATTYMESREYEKAVRYYEMWLKAEPDNANARAGFERAKAGLEKQK